MIEKTPLELLESTLKAYLENPKQRVAAAAKFADIIPAGRRAEVDAILGSKSQSYREGLVIQLAYGLTASSRLDLTVRHKGARGMEGVAGRLSKFLAANHISCTRDAYQNIGKNSVSLVRGNFSEWDSLLAWLSRPEVTRAELQAILSYACAAFAATAKNIRAMPELSLSKLTFGVVSGLIEKMFESGSKGAYEQFTIAALLQAFPRQAAATGYRVETKNLNASDRSSRVPGDIQILVGNRVVEAYEVTAEGFSLKVAGVGQTMRDYDLPRFNIVADIADRAGLLAQLAALKEDIAVLDLRGFAASLVSCLTKEYRAAALNRLYELLDRYQPEDRLVNDYVGLIEEHGLAAPFRKAT